MRDNLMYCGRRRPARILRKVLPYLVVGRKRAASPDDERGCRHVYLVPVRRRSKQSPRTDAPGKYEDCKWNEPAFANPRRDGPTQGSGPEPEIDGDVGGEGMGQCDPSTATSGMDTMNLAQTD